MRLQHGEIWLVDLEPIRVGELGKRRPCLIVSESRYNQSAAAMLVMPITSYPPSPRAPSLLASPAAGLSKDSSILPLHIRAVARSRFVHRLGRAPDALIEQAVAILLVVIRK